MVKEYLYSTYISDNEEVIIWKLYFHRTGQVKYRIEKIKHNSPITHLGFRILIEYKENHEKGIDFYLNSSEVSEEEINNFFKEEK